VLGRPRAPAQATGAGAGAAATVVVGTGAIGCRPITRSQRQCERNADAVVLCAK